MEANKKMDEALEARVKALDAANDETGDGSVDWKDLKSQLNRIEAQLELQDQQNRKIMKNQCRRLILAVVLAVVLVGAVIFLWFSTNAAYEAILETCAQVNELADTVQSSLEVLDPEEIDQLVQELPSLLEQLNRVDVDALNEVANRLPAVMDGIALMQEQVNSLLGTLSNFSLGALLGGAA